MSTQKNQYSPINITYATHGILQAQKYLWKISQREQLSFMMPFFSTCISFRLTSLFLVYKCYVHLHYIKIPQSYPKSWWDRFTISSKRKYVCLRLPQIILGTHAAELGKNFSPPSNLLGASISSTKVYWGLFRMLAIKFHALAISYTKRLRISAKN